MNEYASVLLIESEELEYFNFWCYTLKAVSDLGFVKIGWGTHILEKATATEVIIFKILENHYE